MSIEGVTGSQIIQKLKNIEKSSSQTQKSKSTSQQSDEVNISQDAKLARTLNRAFENIETSPDVRQDRVEDVKEKLQEGFYDKPEVINEVADQLTDVFLGTQ